MSTPVERMAELSSTLQSATTDVVHLQAELGDEPQAFALLSDVHTKLDDARLVLRSASQCLEPPNEELDECDDATAEMWRRPRCGDGPFATGRRHDE